MTHFARVRSSSDAESGSAMVLVMSIMAALLAGGSIAVYMQVKSVASTKLIKAQTDSLYCAEAGLQKARPQLGANYQVWAGILNQSSYPLWYQAPPSLTEGYGAQDEDGDGYAEGDIDKDGSQDFWVRIEDNNDETVGNNLQVDNDLKVFMISSCSDENGTTRQIRELVSYGSAGNNYSDQSGGGSGHTGNVTGSD